MTEGSRDENILMVAHALNAVSHSVAGPLQNAMNRVFALRKRVAASCPDAADGLADLERDFRLVAGRLEDLFALPRACRPPIALPVAIGEIATDAVSLAGDFGTRLVVSIDTPAAVVSIDPGQAAMAVAALITNAFEASPAGAEVHLRVTVTDAEATFAVANEAKTSWPSPPEQAIDPLYTTKARSLGLGLPLAHSVARAAGGAIRIDAGSGQSVVSLVVPVHGH